MRVRCAVAPHELTIERAVGIDRADDVGAHVAQLNAVPDLVARVDRVREPLPGVVEVEVRDVADVHGFCARGL
jgi:hypothetical protein